MDVDVLLICPLTPPLTYPLIPRHTHTFLHTFAYIQYYVYTLSSTSHTHPLRRSPPSLTPPLTPTTITLSSLPSPSHHSHHPHHFLSPSRYKRRLLTTLIQYNTIQPLTLSHLPSHTPLTHTTSLSSPLPSHHPLIPLLAPPSLSLHPQQVEEKTPDDAHSIQYNH